MTPLNNSQVVILDLLQYLTKMAEGDREFAMAQVEQDAYDKCLASTGVPADFVVEHRAFDA